MTLGRPTPVGLETSDSWTRPCVFSSETKFEIVVRFKPVLAVGVIPSSLFGRPVYLPEDGEYVADGAAKQIAWTLFEAEPVWHTTDMQVID